MDRRSIDVDSLQRVTDASTTTLLPPLTPPTVRAGASRTRLEQMAASSHMLTASIDIYAASVLAVPAEQPERGATST